MNRWFALVLLTGIFYLTMPVAPFRTLSDVELASLLQSEANPLSVGERTKTDDCQLRGPFPDSECTPGAIFPNATTAVICVPGYTKTVRDVPVSLKKQIYREYGIEYLQPTGSYEADHLIPLALGGNNDIANLFPESAEPRPGFKEKDIVEIYLHDEVCAGRIGLAVAQSMIAHDWLTVFEQLTPEQLRELRTRFSNWSN